MSVWILRPNSGRERALFGRNPGNEGATCKEPQATIGLRPTFGKLTVESGFAYYSYPQSAQVLSYGEIYLAPKYEITSKLTLGLSTYYGPNYYRSGAWENYNAVSGKYDLGHGLTLSAELGRL